MDKVIYTPDQVHADIIDLANAYKQELSNQPYHSDMISYISYMTELHLHNCADYEYYKKEVGRSYEIECVEWITENFKDIILLKADEFADLLVKYNLYCADFSAYKGHFPTGALLKVFYFYNRLKKSDKAAWQFSETHVNVLYKKLETRKYDGKIHYFLNDISIPQKRYNYLWDMQKRIPYIFDSFRHYEKDLFLIASNGKEVNMPFYGKIETKYHIVFKFFRYGVAILDEFE